MGGTLVVDGTFAGPTSGTTFDVNFAGVSTALTGFELSASTAISDSDGASGNMVAEASGCTGVCDGSAQGCIASQSDDNVPNSIAKNYGTSSYVAVLLGTGSNNNNDRLRLIWDSFLPDTGSGVGIRFRIPEKAASATVAAGGTGYTNGDTLTLAGGTFVQAATFTATVSGGVVTAVTPVNPGAYTTTPSNAASTTGGTGSGCTLNVTYSNWFGASAYRLGIRAYMGVSLDAGLHTTSSSIAGTATESLSVNPEAIKFLGTGNALDSVKRGPSNMGVGFAAINPGGSLAQCCCSRNATDNAATSQDQVLVDSGKIYTDLSEGIPGGGYRYVEVAFGTNQFTSTLRNQASAVQLLYLAFNFNGEAVPWVGLFTTPTSTATTSFSDPNFRPQAIQQVANGASVAGTAATGAGASPIAFCYFTAASEFTIGILDEDNRATMDTAAWWASSACILNFNDPADVVFDYEWASFTSTGWTITNNATSAVARLWPTFIISQGTTKTATVAGVSGSHGALKAGLDQLGILSGVSGGHGAAPGKLDLGANPSGVSAAHGAPPAQLILGLAPAGLSGAHGAAAFGQDLTIATSGVSAAYGAARAALDLALGPAGISSAHGACLVKLDVGLAPAGASGAHGGMMALALDLGVHPSGVAGAHGALAARQLLLLSPAGLSGAAQALSFFEESDRPSICLEAGSEVLRELQAGRSVVVELSGSYARLVELDGSLERC